MWTIGSALRSRTNSSLRRRLRFVELRLEKLESRDVPIAGYFRIVSYNITSSGGTGVPNPDLYTILQGIGNEQLNSVSAPIDVISLQEIKSQATTSKTVADNLNALYSTTAFKYGSVNGGSLGSGTQGVVYNSDKLQLMSQETIGLIGSAPNPPRQTLRYLFHPIGFSTANDFYLYSSHFKSDTDSTSESRRFEEAKYVRTDSDKLGNAAILYTGDLNIYNGTSDDGFQHLLSDGAGQAEDPLNMVANWHDDSKYLSIFTQAPLFNAPSGFSGGGLDDRFDFILQTTELDDNVGFEIVPNTYHTFGNNGSVPINGNINDPMSKALMGLGNRLTILDNLTTVSDHLPVVADYHLVAPKVASYVVGDGTNQRSRVTQMVVTFNSVVSLPLPNPATAFQLKRNSDNALVNLSASVGGGGTTSVTLTFTGGSVEAGSLADGRYTLTIDASKVANGILDGDGNGIGGDNYVLVGDLTNKLFRLFGDVDGNGIVDLTDFGAFRSAFGTNSTVFTIDGSGPVDLTDFGAFRGNFNKMV